MPSNPAVRLWDHACTRCVPLIEGVVPPATTLKIQAAMKAIEILSEAGKLLIAEIESLERERDALARELAARLQP